MASDHSLKKGTVRVSFSPHFEEKVERGVRFRHYQARVHYLGYRRFNAPYMEGEAHFRETDHERGLNLLRALAMDYTSETGSFTDFCDEFGYDEDSRKAYATFEELKRLKVEMDRVFGDHIEHFLEKFRDE